MSDLSQALVDAAAEAIAAAVHRPGSRAQAREAVAAVLETLAGERRGARRPRGRLAGRSSRVGGRGEDRRGQMTEYRHEVDYLADQLRQYIDGVMQEGTDHMRREVGGVPEFAERLQGYVDAMEDVQIMLRDPNHQFHRGLRRYIVAAREVPRGR